MTRKVGRPSKVELASALGTNVEELPDGGVDADGLTPRQRRILELMRDSIAECGYPPSVREIAREAGLASPSSISYQMRELEEKGFISRDKERARAFSLNLPASMQPELPEGVVPLFPANTVSVPVVGRIAAGTPILAEEHVEDTFTLPTQLVGSGTLFMVEVRGDSMVEAAICDGDYVVVKQQNEAVNGDIVAALIEDEATVKTFKRVGNQVWLMPHNPAYEPIDGNNATILGKVVSVMRRI
ncbi:MAG: transcriptional repressor LexA [Propionibacteriaceae bacterium]|jgi:repressor LexA|nr:transcriptional repressor LexA [Propionibacteriaceae bacterium]